MSSPDLNIEWCNRSNDLHSFNDLLLNSGYMSDVIVTNGVNQIRCHRIILSSASTFFFNLLQQNNKSETVIYIGEVDFDTMHAFLKYIYVGNVIISSAKYDQFRQLADRFYIRGLPACKPSFVANHLDPCVSSCDSAEDPLSARPSTPARAASPVSTTPLVSAGCPTIKTSPPFTANYDLKPTDIVSLYSSDSDSDSSINLIQPSQNATDASNCVSQLIRNNNAHKDATFNPQSLEIKVFKKTSYSMTNLPEMYRCRNCQRIFLSRHYFVKHKVIHHNDTSHYSNDIVRIFTSADDQSPSTAMTSHAPSSVPLTAPTTQSAESLLHCTAGQSLSTPSASGRQSKRQRSRSRSLQQRAANGSAKKAAWSAAKGSNGNRDRKRPYPRSPAADTNKRAAVVSAAVTSANSSVQVLRVESVDMLLTQASNRKNAGAAATKCSQSCDTSTISPAEHHADRPLGGANSHTAALGVKSRDHGDHGFRPIPRPGKVARFATVANVRDNRLTSGGGKFATQRFSRGGRHRHGLGRGDRRVGGTSVTQPCVNAGSAPNPTNMPPTYQTSTNAVRVAAFARDPSCVYT